MSEPQAGILATIPRVARYVSFTAAHGRDPRPALRELARLADGEATVVGLGASLVQALGKTIDGLRLHPTHTAPGFDVPSTPAALWCWLRGDDAGDLVHRARAIEHALAGAFEPGHSIDAFSHHEKLDLTGYEDGTENPTGDDAIAAATVSGRGRGLDGGSFVAVQQWVHDFETFDAMSPQQQDHVFGRRRSDNEELDDAPPSAHVKRTAQEGFEPEAFVLRRSMPWTDGRRAGLVFVAFGRSFDAYEAQLRRMVGLDDGITDALFTMTRPVTGSTFWCPPVRDGQLDLSALGLTVSP